MGVRNTEAGPGFTCGDLCEGMGGSEGKWPEQRMVV